MRITNEWTEPYGYGLSYPYKISKGAKQTQSEANIN